MYRLLLNILWLTKVVMSSSPRLSVSFVGPENSCNTTALVVNNM